MITRIFDNGWGKEWPLKQFEIELVEQYISTLPSQQKWVLINSTWYTDAYHNEVLDELSCIDFDGIVLVALLDAAIPQPDRFKHLNKPILPVGYYKSNYEIDFWALVVDHYMDTTPYVPGEIDIAYMCLNRKPHWHRKRLFNHLEQHGLLDYGLVSLGGDENNPPGRILELDQGHSKIAPNDGRNQNGIYNDLVSLGHPHNWQRHFLNVVTETVFDIKQNHFVSEKIYKPIVGEKPFLVYDSDGATTWLRDHGFCDYVNEFSDISNLDLSDHENIPEFLSVLCKQGTQYWKSKTIALSEKIAYNKAQFQKHVQQQRTKINQGIQCQV
jgi:hypothetical protein